MKANATLYKQNLAYAASKFANFDVDVMGTDGWPASCTGYGNFSPVSNGALTIDGWVGSPWLSFSGWLKSLIYSKTVSIQVAQRGNTYVGACFLG